MTPKEADFLLFTFADTDLGGPMARMSVVWTSVCMLLALIPSSLSNASQMPPATLGDTSQVSKGLVATAYGKLPLSFEPNRGQADGRVKFLSRGQGYALFLTPTEAVLSLRKGDIRSRPSSLGGPRRDMRSASGAVRKMQRRQAEPATVSAQNSSQFALQYLPLAG
jgi:hypothetical protein